jgi:hypothetical protein
MQEGGEKKLVEPGYDAGLDIGMCYLQRNLMCQFFC